MTSSDFGIHFEFKANCSYIYVPFVLKESVRKSSIDYLRDAHTCIENSKYWTFQEDKPQLKYMLKYVSDKIYNPNNPEKRQCYFYKLKPEYLDKSWNTVVDNKTSEVLTFCPSEVLSKLTNVPYEFCLEEVLLYLFSTTVGILAFKVHMKYEDPIYISSVLYELKKVSRVKFLKSERNDGSGQRSIKEIDDQRSCKEIDDQRSSKEIDDQEKAASQIDSVRSLLDLANYYLQPLKEKFDPTIFYYANYGQDRANVLSYVEIDEKDKEKASFYLKNCKEYSYSYDKTIGISADESYHHSPPVLWNFTPEALICFCFPENCPDERSIQFQKTTFAKNFDEQYAFMYVMLLHQKYTLYMFLTRIESDDSHDIEKLTRYRRELFKFQSDFVYTRITEVPQYQDLYDKLFRIFDLKEMYEDITEPLDTLDVLQEAEADKRESKMNRLLFLLSILGVFSALVDSFDFIEEFMKSFFPTANFGLYQKIAVGMIFIIFIYIMGCKILEVSAALSAWWKKRRK